MARQAGFSSVSACGELLSGRRCHRRVGAPGADVDDGQIEEAGDSIGGRSQSGLYRAAGTLSGPLAEPGVECVDCPHDAQRLAELGGNSQNGMQRPRLGIGEVIGALIEERVATQAPQPRCGPEQRLAAGSGQARAELVDREAIRRNATEQLLDRQLGELSYCFARLVAEAIGAGLLFVHDVVVDELVAERAVWVLHQRPREQEHRFERPQVAVFFPAFAITLVLNAARELDEQSAARVSGPRVLERKAPIGEALEKALGGGLVTASAQ